jgi:hypothetical protein
MLALAPLAHADVGEWTMRTTLLWALLPILSVAACQLTPVENASIRETPSDSLVPPVAAGDINLACTREWANGVDGNWEDPGKWFPAGLPNVNDSVCLTTAGSYTVTISSSQSVLDMQVGAATFSTVTLRMALPPGDTLRVGASLSGWGATVKTGSSIVIDGSNSGFAIDSYAGLTNDGLIRVSNSCSCANASGISFKRFYNHGTLHLAGAATLTADGFFENDGIVSVTAPFPVTMVTGFGDSFDQDGGQIVGTQYLDVRGGWASSFSWRGGTISANANDPTKSVLRVFSALHTTIDAPSAAGRVDLINDFGISNLVGRIGAGVHVRIAALQDHEIRIFPDVFQASPFVNDGVLEFIEDPAFATGHAITVTGTPLVNDGQLKVTGGQGVEFTVDSVVNRGAVLVNGTLAVSGNGHLFRNRGSVVVGNVHTLEVASGATFDAAAGSTMTGRLLLTNGTVQGTGTVGDVTSVGGSIRPSAPAGLPVGVLTASSVTMDATTGLTLDVAGASPGTFDQLVVTGPVTYAGTLTVTNVAPFVGGFCGQVLPVISDRSAGPRGAFNKFVGLVQPGLVNRWRVHNPARRFELVGYNPVAVPVFVNQSSLAVSEAGGAASYNVCLGPTAPTADVVVTPAASLGEIGVVPTPLTFPLATWLLPQTVTVTANNDATVDSLVTDTVLNAVTSADPAYNGTPAGAVPVTVTDDDGNTDLAVAAGDVVPPTLVVGQQFTARYNISNAGPTLSTGSTFTIPGLTGFAFVSGSGGTCAMAGGALRCQLAGLAAGASLNITLTLRPLSVGAHANTISIVGQQPDPNAANNSIVQQLTVQ